MVQLNLEHLLEKNNKSKYWLVTQLDSSYTAVNKMLRHESTAITFDMLERLHKVFDCKIEDLFHVE